MLKNKLMISLQLLLELIKMGKNFIHRNIIIKNNTIKFKTNQRNFESLIQYLINNTNHLKIIQLYFPFQNILTLKLLDI